MAVSEFKAIFRRCRMLEWCHKLSSPLLRQRLRGHQAFGTAGKRTRLLACRACSFLSCPAKRAATHSAPGRVIVVLQYFQQEQPSRFSLKTTPLFGSLVGTDRQVSSQL